MDDKETRPWGWFQTIETGLNFKIKKLFIKAGHSISLQSHNCRDEHWIVVNGCGILKQGDKLDSLSEISVNAGKQISIPKLQKHKILATEDLTIIEVQYGICDESDIKRYQDDYGRI